MRVVIVGCVAAAAGLFFAGCAERSHVPAPVQADPPVAGDAGEEYLALHAALGPPLFGSVRQAQGTAGPELVGELEAKRDEIDRLAYATRMEECDWGLPERPNMDTRLPHLGKVRDLARVLKLDAGRLAEAGDADAASRRVAAIVRLARHAAEAGAGSMIEWLTGIAVLGLATEAAERYAADLGSQGGRVLAELRAIEQADPFGLSSTLARDRERSGSAGVEPADEAQMRDTAARIADKVASAIKALEEAS